MGAASYFAFTIIGIGKFWKESGEKNGSTPVFYGDL
ncbi:hypothetical protein PT2222_170082 [Paraburkholderia tropica]